MERENIEFYKKVRNGYLLLAKSMPERIVVVDGTLPENQIEREIWKVVKKALDLKTAPAPKKVAAKKKSPSKKTAK